MSLRNYCIRCPTLEEIWPFHEYPFCGYPFWSCSKKKRRFETRNFSELKGGFLHFPWKLRESRGVTQKEIRPENFQGGPRSDPEADAGTVGTVSRKLHKPQLRGTGTTGSLAPGTYWCRKVRVYPAECGRQLATDPSKNGSSKSLVLKSFFLERSTLELLPSSLPHTLGCACTLCTPLPLPPEKCFQKTKSEPKPCLSLVTRPKYPPLSRERCSNTPVALRFLWYRRLSLLHPHFFL